VYICEGIFDLRIYVTVTSPYPRNWGIIGSELVRPNQVVNPMRGLRRRESEMEMKSKVVQLCIDVSTWSMVAILRLGRIRVKGEIVRIVTEIHHEGSRNFGDQRTDVHKELCTVVLILGIVE